MFYQEAVLWKRMNHPNIVLFCGVPLDPLQFVSGWVQAVGLTECVNTRPGINRLGLVGFPFTALVELQSPHLLSSYAILLRA